MQAEANTVLSRIKLQPEFWMLAATGGVDLRGH